MVLKHVGVASAAKICGVMYGAMGLLVGMVLSAVFAMIPAAWMQQSDAPGMPGWIAPMFGVGAIIFMPIFYGVMGVITGALGAVFYNLFAGMVGGLELQLDATYSADRPPTVSA